MECVERHTAENLYQKLKTCFKNCKVVAVFSDNAANIKAAIKLGNWRHIECFAHSFNLIVQDSLKNIDVLKKN